MTPTEIGSIDSVTPVGADPAVDVAVADNKDNGDGAAAASSEVDNQNKGQQAGEPIPNITWDGNQFAIKFRGKTVVPKSREELLEFAQLGYNNDNRIKSLNEREAQLKKIEHDTAQYQKLAKAFETVPDFAKAVYALYDQYTKSGNAGAINQASPTPPDSGTQELFKPYIDKISELEQKLSTVESRFQTYDQSQVDKQVEEEIAGLQKQYSDEDWKSKDENGKTLAVEILEHAAKHNYPTLAAAYRDLRWDTRENNLKAAILKQAEEQKRKEGKAGIIGKGGAGVSPRQTTEVNPRNMNWNQIAEMAIKNSNEI